ncbi:MAG: flagellar biosynthetic protein FliR [Chloroflexota bacterium]
MTLLTTRYDLYFLLFVRCAGLFSVAPVLGSRYVPTQVRIALAAALAFFLLPATSVPAGGLPRQLPAYFLAVISETLIGLVIGWVATLIFSAAQLGGELLDMQMGFGMTNVIDPQFGVQVPLIGNFQYMLAAMVFLTINGHHLLIQALAASTKLIPVAGAGFTPDLTWFIVDGVQGLFITAIKIVAPAIGALFLTNVALGLIARSMPQMNVFVVGMPVHLAVGALTMAVAMPLYVAMLQGAFDGLTRTLTGLLRLLGQG